MYTWDLMSGDIKGHPGKEFGVNSKPIGLSSDDGPGEGSHS